MGADRHDIVVRSIGDTRDTLCSIKRTLTHLSQRTKGDAMNPTYHWKAPELLEKKTPDALGMEYTSVQRLEIRERFTLETGAEEICLVVLEGAVEFQCEGQQGQASVKDMLYTPRQQTIQLTSDAAVLMAFGAPAHIDAPFAHIRFAEIDQHPDTHQIFGNKATNCRRDVWHFIGADFPCSRLMMGMCVGEPGGWTVWPPHEHAAEREEVYLYFGMGDAFGIQCVYDDMDDPYVVAMVRDGDLISIPRGYHPNVGCPAGRISFIYCMVAKTPGQRDFMDLHFQEIYGESF
ncbi:hypothetical protein GF339_11665 [candidate division KSB3 bacterium]|uniref:5-deoxy-glucuronate isomerase n=1 Tax=candidate division KSB3 bacterium TaxID=2044937 RepID=A0A9D5JW61_9BACT|nr:hypothetical protein [candidate division KSB3 bacterium]MBD3325235.1 hypothetical protein [candidate division KSB3 bacterium]